MGSIHFEKASHSSSTVSIITYEVTCNGCKHALSVILVCLSRFIGQEKTACRACGPNDNTPLLFGNPSEGIPAQAGTFLLRQIVCVRWGCRGFTGPIYLHHSE